MGILSLINIMKGSKDEKKKIIDHYKSNFKFNFVVVYNVSSVLYSGTKTFTRESKG